MSMKGLINNVKAALGVKSSLAKGKSSSKGGRKASSLNAPGRSQEMDWSSRTADTTLLSKEFNGQYENAFFREELMHLQERTSIRRVTLQDFVQRYERDDLAALDNILTTSKRQWKAIKFLDTVDGENYRRWIFKKENLRRALEKHSSRLPIIFEEHIKIDMDEMPSAKIAALLKAVKKDAHVRLLSFDGFLNYKEIDAVVHSLVKLLESDKRRWKKIVMRCSFDGEEFDEWNDKIQDAKKRLGNITATRGIPIVLSIC